MRRLHFFEVCVLFIYLFNNFSPSIAQGCSNPNDKCRSLTECRARHTKAELRQRRCSINGAKGFCCSDNNVVNSNNLKGKIDEEKKKQDHIEEIADYDYDYDYDFGVKSGGSSPNKKFVPKKFMDTAFEFEEKDMNKMTSSDFTSKYQQGYKDEEINNAAYLHSFFQKATDEAANVADLGMQYTLVAKHLKNQKVDYDGEARFDGMEDRDLYKQCVKETEVPPCDTQSKYRTIDGSCNNWKKPHYGKSSTPMSRIWTPEYDDENSKPRTKSSSGAELPSSRKVSRAVAGDEVEESQYLTALGVTFGQFIDHDLAHTPVMLNDKKEALQCCTKDTLKPVKPEDGKLTSDFCFPIMLENDDPMITKRQDYNVFDGDEKRCLNFARSMGGTRSDCQISKYKEQINQITHWLDSSNVYGSEKKKSDELRAFRNGLLKTTKGDDGSDHLPLQETKRGEAPLAGDERAGEQPALTAMHTLFVREHNRIAEELGPLNPNWDDEKLFQESKRIVNAEYQHIIYNEWLPILLGKDYLKIFGMAPLTRGFSFAYSNEFDPTLTNEFATGAFRVGHSWINSIIKTFDDLSKNTEFRLQNSFFGKGLGEQLRDNNMLDEVIRGMCKQASKEADNNFVEDIRGNLFGGPSDLLALNIQRGRDHGIPPYVKARRECSAPIKYEFNNWDDSGLSKIKRRQRNKLRKVYEKPEDIDMFVGAFSEGVNDPGNNGVLGPTFKCIIGDMFFKFRFGDRFFYDNGAQAGSFTEDQLNQIRKTSMARLICDNTIVDRVQKLAFEPIDDLNDLKRCDSRLLLEGIDRVDLTVFKE